MSLGAPETPSLAARPFRREGCGGGVAGGELLIPTIVLLYGIDIKLAGSLSLAVSLPTMLVAFARYSQDASFQILRTNKAFVVMMTAGSIA